jgi:hypothetical protein
VLKVPTSNALAVSQLTFIERGSKVDKEYLRLFPSLNASFNVRENLIARAAYYYSIGRPNFDQYAGALTLPDESLPPASNNRYAPRMDGVPALGQHTEGLLAELGYSSTQVGALRDAGVV